MNKKFKGILLVLGIGVCVGLIFVVNILMNREGKMINDRDTVDDSATVKNNILREGEDDHYVLNFNDSRMCFDEIKPDSKFYNKTPPNIAVNHFSDSLSWSRIGRIGFTLYAPAMVKMNLIEKLEKANIAEQRIINAIMSFADSESLSYFSKPKITDQFVLDEDLILVKGTYLYMDTELDPGYELAYFGVFSIKQNKILLEDNVEFMRAISINGKRYFVTHFQKPEACQEAVIIFKLDEGVLASAFDIWGSIDNQKF